MRHYLLALLMVLGSSCGVPQDSRQRLIISTLLGADEAILQSRPNLVANKYAIMATSPFHFYRGSMAMFLRDTSDPSQPVSYSDFAINVPLVRSIGDVHPENIGILLAADQSLALEPVDFDMADDYPYLWELRRLAVSLALYARAADIGGGDDASIAATAAAAYAKSMQAFMHGQPRMRVTSATDPILSDVFERAAKDLADRSELNELTLLPQGESRFIRGPSIDDSSESLIDLPDFARNTLDATLKEYQHNFAPKDETPLEILDAVRALGRGVGSLPRLRAYVLVQYAGDTPGHEFILEVKEIPESNAPFLQTRETRFLNNGVRILDTAHRVWTRADTDIQRNVSHWLGLDVQIRPVRSGEKVVRLKRVTGKRATFEALHLLSSQLGTLLAGMHAASGKAAIIAIAQATRNNDAFALEQGEAAHRYAEIVEEDSVLFREALQTRGALLGFRANSSDVPEQLRELWDVP